MRKEKEEIMEGIVRGKGGAVNKSRRKSKTGSDGALRASGEGRGGLQNGALDQKGEGAIQAWTGGARESGEAILVSKKGVAAGLQQETDHGGVRVGGEKMSQKRVSAMRVQSVGVGAGRKKELGEIGEAAASGKRQAGQAGASQIHLSAQGEKNPSQFKGVGASKRGDAARKRGVGVVGGSVRGGAEAQKSADKVGLASLEGQGQWRAALSVEGVKVRAMGAKEIETVKNASQGA